MPNWCYNHLTLSNDDKSKIDALQEVLSSKNDQDVHNGELFQHLRPRPEEFNESWYSWNVDNWGTKWEVSPDDWNLVDDNTISVSFDSAWNAPIELYEYLSEEGWLVDAFYEESGVGFCGKYFDGDNECYEYNFEEEDWRDGIPEDVIEFANLEQTYEDWKEWQEDEEDEA